MSADAPPLVDLMPALGLDGQVAQGGRTMTPVATTHTDPAAEMRRLHQEITTLRRQLEDAEQRARRHPAGTLVPTPESRSERRAREEAFELRAQFETTMRLFEQARQARAAQIDVASRPARCAQVATVRDLADRLVEAATALAALDQQMVAAGGTKPDSVLGSFVATWKVERERLARAGWFLGD